MYKALLFGTALTVTVTSMVIMAPSSARLAFAGEAFTVAEDSVFMDEGDGDFATAPVAAKTETAPEAKAEPKAAAPKAEKKAKPAKTAKADTKKADKNRKPSSEETSAPDSLDDLEAAAANTEKAPSEVAETPAQPEQQPVAAEVAAPAKEEAPQVATETAEPVKEEEKPAKKLPSKKAKATKTAKASGSKGKFANTEKECPLLREPASESETMATVKASRKIWVEEVDASWVRAFNKAGEPGYVSTGCFGQ